MNHKSARCHTKLLLLMSFIYCILSPYAFAQTDTTGAIPLQQPSSQADLVYAVTHLVGGYGVKELKKSPLALFHVSKDSAYNLLVGDVINAIVNPKLAGQVAYVEKKNDEQAKKKQKQTLTSQALLNYMTNTTPKDTIAQSMQIPGPLPLGKRSQGVGFLGPTGIKQTKNTCNFDQDSLLSPLQYSKKQKQCALNFVKFAAGLVAPPGVVDLSQLSAKDLKTALQDNADLQKYLVAFRVMTATQSVAISNLYYLYAERLPRDTKDLAKNLPEMKDTALYPKASILQIEHYLGTRRMTDDSWHKNIQKLATPAELLRQINYELRDLLYISVQRQYIEERILIAQTALVSQLTMNNQVMMEQLKSKAQQAITGKKGSNTQEDKNLQQKLQQIKEQR